MAGLAPFVAVAEIARAAVGADRAALDEGVIWAWVAVGIAGASLRLALVFASSRLGHHADARLLHGLRVQIVRHLAAVPLGWFRARGSGAVKKAMTDDLEEMHQLIAHALGELVGAASAIVAGLTYLALVDLRMALITLAVLVLTAIVYRVAMRSMPGHVERLIRAEQRISAASVEYADGIAVVKAFGVGDRILARFAAAVREYVDAFRAWVDEVLYSSSLDRLLASEMTILGVATAAGLALVHDGSLTVADLLPFLVVAVGLPTSINPAIQGAQGLRKGRVAAGHVDALLSLPPLPAPARPRWPRGHRVELERVTFSYDGAVDALTDVSAVCEPGTVTAIVGPSGSGKTTLASLLPRFHDVRAGAIRIGGVDVRELDQATLLSSISLVFQDVVLLRDTVAQNIRIGRPGATDADVRQAARAARVHDVIERLPDGYETVLGERGGGLSGGERQRVTIARAILADAPIVVLDEATASLDPDSETHVQRALAALAAGKTLIVVAHRLHTIAGADQILVLDGGRLVEAGTHPDLLARGGRYARMWQAQETEAVA